MASRWWDKFLSLTDSAKISGRFQPNGSSAPANVFFPGATVARTGVGTFLVTFADKFPNWEAIVAQLHNPLANSDVVITNVNVAAKTMALTTRTSGAATDLAVTTDQNVVIFGSMNRSSRIP